MGRNIGRVFFVLSLSFFVAACGSRSSGNSTENLDGGEGADPGTSAPFSEGTFGGSGTGTPPSTISFGDDKDGKDQAVDLGSTAGSGLPASTTPNKTLGGESLLSQLLPFADQGIDAFNVPQSLVNRLPFLLGGIDNLRPLNFSTLPPSIQQFITCAIIARNGQRVSEFTLVFSFAASLGVTLTNEEQLSLVQTMGTSTTEQGRINAAARLLSLPKVVDRIIGLKFGQFLGRAPTANDLARQRSIYNSTNPNQWETVIADITGQTAEFMRRSLGGVNPNTVSFNRRFSAYVNLLTYAVLGRPATVAEKNAEVTAVRNAINNRTVAAGAPARKWLTRRILAKWAFEKAFVEITSQTILGRRDAAEVNAWTARMQSNELDMRMLIAVVLGSIQNYNRVQSQFGFVQEFYNTCGSNGF